MAFIKGEMLVGVVKAGIAWLFEVHVVRLQVNSCVLNVIQA